MEVYDSVKAALHNVCRPWQVALVSTSSKVMGKEKDNIIVLAWHTPLSHEPFLYGIAIGKTRFSCQLVRDAGCFVVNFIGPEHEKDAWFCGTHSGRTSDKFSATRFTREDSERLDSVRIKEAIAHLECEVVAEHEVGDHILFVGKVVHAGLKEQGDRLISFGGDRFGKA
ncbi:MAG: flavin reductase family protein [Nanoarchaeota archaeon]|nr:flavin reductase family protein [Nanoarchaeota archaeon]